MAREASDDEDALEARYANYFTIGHNAFEFLFDFGVFCPEGSGCRMHTRVVTTPAYAKVLVETLLDSIGHFEHAFGPIKNVGHDEH